MFNYRSIRSFFLTLISLTLFSVSSVFAQQSYDPANVSQKIPAANSYNYSTSISQRYSSFQLTFGTVRPIVAHRPNALNLALFGYRLATDAPSVRKPFSSLPGHLSLTNTFAQTAPNYTVNTLVTFDPRKLATGTYYFYFTYGTQEGDEENYIYQIKITT